MRALVIISPPKAQIEPAFQPPKSCSIPVTITHPKRTSGSQYLTQGGRKEVGGKKTIQALHLSVILSLICCPCWSLF